MKPGSRHTAAVIAALGVCSWANGASASPVLRQTDGFLSDGESPGAIATLDDRFVLVLLPSLERAALLDTLTWQWVTDDAGTDRVGVCASSSGRERPHAVVPWSAGTASGFVVSCDAGIVSTITLDESGDEPTWTVSSAAVSSVSGAAVDAPLVGVAAESIGGRLFLLSADGIVYVSTQDDPAEVTSEFSVSAVGTVDASSSIAVLATGTATSVAVASAGSLLIYSVESSTYDAATCAGGDITDLAARGTYFLVAVDASSSANSLAFITPAEGFPTCTPVTWTSAGAAHLSSLAVDTTASGTGGVWAAGAVNDVDAIFEVTLVAGSPLTATVVSAVALPVGTGSVAAHSALADLVFHTSASTAAVDLYSDKPFITVEAEVTESDTSDDGDATPSSSTSSAQDVTITFTTDEGGTYTVSFNDEEATGSVAAGATGEETFTLSDSDGGGSYDAVVTVEDGDGNIGQTTYVVNIDFAPEAPEDFTGGFGDAKMILTWALPSDDDIVGYELIMAAADLDTDPGFDTGAEFMSSPLAASGQGRFSVTYDGETVTYPDSLDADGSWPVTIALEDVEASLQGLSYTISPLRNWAGESSYTTYHAAIRAVDASGKYSAWTDVVSAVPEQVCGAACLAGDDGGFCAVVSPRSRGGVHLGEVLIALVIGGLVVGRGRKARR